MSSPSRLRVIGSDILALVKRIGEHTEAAEKERETLFGGEAVARSARIIECLDIAYEIGSDEERTMIDEIRKRKDE